MKIFQALFLFLFSLFLIPGISAMENILPGKDVNGFSVQIKGDSYQLQYKGKTIVSRKGTLKNWEKYSRTESMTEKVVRCPFLGNAEYHYGSSGISNNPNVTVIKKEDYKKCMDSYLGTIYYISKKSDRYYIIGVGKMSFDFTGGVPFESYIFDSITGKMLQIPGIIFLNGDTNPDGLTILEGKTGIYVVESSIYVIEKDLSKVRSIISIVSEMDFTCKEYNGAHYVRNIDINFKYGTLNKVCVNFFEKTKIDNKYLDLIKVELLSGGRIRIHASIGTDYKKEDFFKDISVY